MKGVSYSPFCMHVLGVDTTEKGKSMVYCDNLDEWRNVTQGECFGHCDMQEVIGGGKPLEWIEPKEGK